MIELNPDKNAEKKKVFLESIRNGTSITDASEGIGVGRTTIYSWFDEDEEFKKATYEMIDSRTIMVEDSLFLSARGGDVQAQKFWLKNRSRERWKDRQEIGHTIETDLNKEEKDELINLTKRAIRRLEDLPEDSKDNS